MVYLAEQNFGLKHVTIVTDLRCFEKLGPSLVINLLFDHHLLSESLPMILNLSNQFNCVGVFTIECVHNEQYFSHILDKVTTVSNILTFLGAFYR